MPSFGALRQRREFLAVVLVLLTIAVILAVGYERALRDEAARDQLRHQYATAVQQALSGLYTDIATIGLLMGEDEPDREGGDAAALANLLVQKREGFTPLHYLARVNDGAILKENILLWSSRLSSFNLHKIPGVTAPLHSLAPRMLGADVVEDADDDATGTHDDDDDVVLVVPIPLTAAQSVSNGRMVGVLDVTRLFAEIFHELPPLTDLVKLDVNGQSFGHWTGPGHFTTGVQPDDELKIVSGTDVIHLDFMAKPMSFSTAIMSWHSLGILLAFGLLAALLRISDENVAFESRPTVNDGASPAQPHDGKGDALGQLRLLGELSQSLSHDLSQPLNIIRLAAEGAIDRLTSAPPDKERLTKTLTNVVDQALALQHKLNAVVSNTRRPSTNPSAFLPAGVVRSALSQLLPRLRAENIKLHWHADLGAPWVVGHAERLEQAIVNLLNNACDSISAANLARRGKSTGPAGTLRVKCFGIDPGDVLITIEDDGVGMPEAIQHRLMDPFPPTSGSLRGIGLPISLGIIAEMDGVMTAPTVPHGARIEIVLPGVAPLVLRKDGPANRHVMVVDDEKGAVDEMEAYLSAHGWTVSSAYGGNQAWSMFLSYPADAVITDLHMSNGDGLSLIGKLHQYAPDMPILAITTARDEESHRAVQAGAALVLTKPVSLADIESELDGLL